MTEYKYIGVSVSELLSDLVDITGSHTESEYLVDEIVDRWAAEYHNVLKVKKGEKTPEQLEQDREYKRLSVIHSGRLRRNMEAKQRFGPDGTSAHHIVPWGKNYLAAERSRIILKQVGIHIDDEENGVYLPTGKKNTPHPDMPNAYSHGGVHTTYYYLNIFDLLSEEKGDKKEIINVLKEIGEDLTKGAFPINRRIQKG